MSQRSRAKPWFVRERRLEGYSVEVDRLEEAGGLWPGPGSVLCAQDFDCERTWLPVATCKHRHIQLKTVIVDQSVPSTWQSKVVCADCGSDYPGQASALPKINIRMFNDQVAEAHDGVRFVASTIQVPNPHPRSGFRRTAYSQTGAAIEDLDT